MLKGKNLFWLKAVTALAVLALCLGPVLTAFPVYADGPDSRDGGTTVATKQPSYKPGETVNITGKGYAANAPVTVMLTKPDGTIVRWTVNADDSGNIATEYALENSTEGVYFVQLSDGTNSAYTIFTDPSNPTYLFPNNDIGGKIQLSRYGDNKNYKCVDDGAGTAWPNTPPHDGDTTYVYTSSTNWKRDIYQFENLPGNYDLGGGGDDNTPPDTPSPSSTSHTVNVWSNNATVVMVWQPVNDAPGSGGTGATVTITAVAREHAGQGYMQFVVVPPARPHDIQIYTPSQGSDLTGNWVVYTYTMATDPDGDPWAINSINNLEAGLQLKANCQARVTQMYLLVTPGSGESSSGLKGYNWYWDIPPTSFTTGTTVTQTLSDGSHNFAVNAEDNAGNTSPFGTSGPYLIDTVAPVLAKLIDGSPAKSGWYNISDVGGDNKLDVELTATDTPPAGQSASGVDYIKFRVDSGSEQKDYNPDMSGVGNGKDYSHTATFYICTDDGSGNPINQGTITLYHSAVDVAGNEGSGDVGASQQIKIDTVAPTLTKVPSGTEGNNGWYISPVQVTLTATDATSGVAEIQFQVDGGGWQTYSAPFTLTQDGVIHLQHQAFDVAGNSYVLPEQDIKIDQTPPTLTKDLNGTQGNNGWYVSPVEVTLTATDATSGVYEIRYTVNGDETAVPGGPEGTNTAEAKFPFTDDGAYALTHETSDYAGHTTELEAQEVRVDQTPPSLAKSAARTGATEVTVTLVGTDATSGVDYIRYSVDGGETWAQAPVVNGYGPNTFQSTFTVEGIGEHELSHLVFDVAGNQYVLGDQMITIERPTPSGTMLYTPRLIITLDILGTTAEYPVTPEGRLITDARVTSPDGSVTLEIPAGTLVLNADRTPTYLNEDYDIVFMNAAPPAAPAGYQIVAAYQAHPAGLTFSRDARLIITYDESKLPQGSSAVIAYYDEAKKEWTPLETAGYVAAGGIEIPNTVVSRVGHFTYFAVLAKLPAAK